jgi:hypothetical protein
MFTVALVEDDEVAARRLRACLDEFTARTGALFEVVEFAEPLPGGDECVLHDVVDLGRTGQDAPGVRAHHRGIPTHEHGECGGITVGRAARDDRVFGIGKAAGTCGRFHDGSPMNTGR